MNTRSRRTGRRALILVAGPVSAVDVALVDTGKRVAALHADIGPVFDPIVRRGPLTERRKN